MTTSTPDQSSEEAPSPVLTVTEAARLLRIGVGKTYELVRKGHIPSIRFRGTRRILIPRSSLMDILNDPHTFKHVEAFNDTLNVSKHNF